MELPDLNLIVLAAATVTLLTFPLGRKTLGLIVMAGLVLWWLLEYANPLRNE